MKILLPIVLAALLFGASAVHAQQPDAGSGAEPLTTDTSSDS